MAMRGMGRMIKSAGSKARKRVGKNVKTRPPKRFDAMTEGRKVSQAKKRIKNKKSKEAAFAEIGRIMKEAGIGQKPTTKTGKMGGGKIYSSMDKKYGGGIYPRKVKM
jgi:hypothetical protein